MLARFRRFQRDNCGNCHVFGSVLGGFKEILDGFMSHVENSSLWGMGDGVELKCSAECGRDTKCLQVAAAYSTRHSMFFRRVVAYSDRTYWPFQYFDRCFACMGSSALLFRLKWGGRAAWHPVPRSPATRPQRLVRWLAHAFSCVLVRSRFLNSSNS